MYCYGHDANSIVFVVWSVGMAFILRVDVLGVGRNGQHARRARATAAVAASQQR